MTIRWQDQSPQIRKRNAHHPVKRPPKLPRMWGIAEKRCDGKAWYYNGKIEASKTSRPASSSWRAKAAEAWNHSENWQLAPKHVHHVLVTGNSYSDNTRQR
ncbi:hypothetical protein CCM_08777 [Cordyceps militaris CM01]|uniref:Uncharacterized protein n=1 Tax=Cordyceps militaris (strain CM01) TaxID=983644 RepID=G3JSD9_CORMM|nr:uncharacterized protein CCM_08777 [Cordyceps militaris CM01]EGX88731.1 hypothetical protein CCM_08777 [Cordyceps militaris CM01]